jgi:hypothetical protein
VKQLLFYCDFPGCESSFTRKGSVARHKKKFHPQQNECRPMVGDGVRNFIPMEAVEEEGNIELVKQHEIRCDQPTTKVSVHSSAANNDVQTDRAKPCRLLPQTKDRRRTRELETCGAFVCDFPGCGKALPTRTGLAKHKTMMKHHMLESMEINVSERKNTGEQRDGHAKPISGETFNQGMTRGAFQCDFPNCGKGLPTKSGLAKHKALKHIQKRIETDVPAKLETVHRLESKMNRDIPCKATVVDQKDLAGYAVKPRLKLPHPSNQAKWKVLDSLISEAFDLSVSKHRLATGSIHGIVNTLGDLIYSIISEEHGVSVPRSANPTKVSTHKKIPRFLEKLRKAKTSARRKARSALRLAERTGDFSQYRDLKRTEVKQLRMYASARKSLLRSQREVSLSVEEARFRKNPFDYSKKIFDPPNQGKPLFSKATADAYFQKAYSDSDRKHQYEAPQAPRPPNPTVPFNLSCPTFEIFSTICWKKSNKSAPGFNGVSFLVYKRCPEVRKRLWLIVKRIWRERVIPKAWKIGRIKLLDKGKGCGQPDEMRPITILNAEGRIFFTVCQERMADFMVKNKYIDHSVQKAFLPEMAGCIEHGTLWAEMMKDAKRKQRSLCMIWLDLANAYGSVRHSLALFAMRWYHIPEAFIQFILDYYGDIMLQVQTDDWKSDWFALEIGVPQGCTASTIIFDIVFQMVLDIHRHLCQGLKIGYTLSESKIAIIAPAYADDVGLVASTPHECQSSIGCFELALAYSITLRLKPPKCRSLAYRKMRSTDGQHYKPFDPELVIYGDKVGFLGDDPTQMFKYLGLWIQYNLGNDKVIADLTDYLKKALLTIDHLTLRGAMKAWIVNYYVLAKMVWPLLINDFSESQAKVWDNLIRHFYRKWLGLAKMAESGIFYRSNAHFGLNMKSLQEMQKQLHVSKWHLLKTSADKKCNQLYQRRLSLDKAGHTGSGRRGSPCLTIERIERGLTLDQLTTSQRGKRGIGFSGIKVKKSSMRQQVVLEMKKEAEDRRLLVADKYQMQTNWVEYASELRNEERKDLTWQRMLSFPQNLLKFTLNAQCNTLYTPDNQRRWNLAPNACCGLCGTVHATLVHILCGCYWVNQVEFALPRSSRFKWRHDCVLEVIVLHLRNLVTAVNARPRSATKNDHFIRFVKSGVQPERPVPGTPLEDLGLLDLARDWEIFCDLAWERKPGSVFVFPQEVVATSYKPDIVLISRREKICIAGPELTAPMEENIASRNYNKRAKYLAELIPNLAKGWTLHYLSLEVGARGWIPPSFMTVLRKLGVNRRSRKQLADDCSDVARRCSYLIWLNRFNRDFAPFPVRPYRSDGKIDNEALTESVEATALTNLSFSDSKITTRRDELACMLQVNSRVENQHALVNLNDHSVPETKHFAPMTAISVKLAETVAVDEVSPSFPLRDVEIPLSPTFRRQLIMIADGNVADTSELVMVAENNLVSLPAGAESFRVENFPCAFLADNKVLLDGKLFGETDFGQRLTGKFGQKHSNACFYLACAEGNEKRAIAFKRKLAPLANKYSVSGSKFKSIDFSGQDTLADTEVFFAFAELVGPICVANRSANQAVSYSHPDRPGEMRFLHLRKTHFTRLSSKV